jgi:hypothetical protein
VKNSHLLKSAFISIFWVLVFVTYYLGSQINYVALLFGVVYTIGFLYKPSKNENFHSFGTTILEFGQDNLIYRDKETTIWHIPYSRLKSIEIQQHGSGQIFSPITQEILILTNYNDSYCIFGSIPESTVSEIRGEIENAKNKSI